MSPFDALVFGYFQDGQLMYAARTRNGSTPATRQKLFKEFKGLEISECPFANLPEKKSGRDATLDPELVAKHGDEPRTAEQTLIGKPVEESDRRMV